MLVVLANCYMKKDILNKEWLSSHLKQVKQQAGARYTPEINVNLPISDIFEGITRSEKFYHSIREHYGKLLRELKNIVSKTYEDEEAQKLLDTLKSKLDPFLKTVSSISVYSTEIIPWNEVKEKSESLLEIIDAFSSRIRTLKYESKEEKSTSKDGSYVASKSELYSFDLSHINKAEDVLRYFNDLSISSKSELSNNPSLLLMGSGGNGKTHLLCDVIEHNLTKDGHISYGVLVFGEYFSSDKDVGSQILEQLGLPESFADLDEFLVAMDTLGAESKRRSLLIIDALNETPVQHFWKNNLFKIIEQVKKYKNVGIVVSVRNGYEKEILSDEAKSELIIVEHHGFPGGLIWDAIQSFFTYYNISFPELPLLHPEFYNPLFLKFFCEKNKNTKPDLKGGDSLKNVFEHFVLEVGLEIIQAFDPGAKPRGEGKKHFNLLWDGIVKDAAFWMAINGQSKIPEKNFEVIISKYFPGKEKEVISLLVRRVLVKKLEWDESVLYGFSYNKFSDHIIVRSILTSVEGSAEREKEFNEGGKIANILVKFKYDHGILEALCVQVPEFFKKQEKRELFQLAPYLTENNNFDYSFKESLIWRDPKTIGTKVLEVINRDISANSSFFLDPILSLVSFPDHALNARYLDSILSGQTLAERDSWWSTFLHFDYREHNAVDRLLEWAWSEHEKSYLSDDSIFLTSITLAWFLTTPNRSVRDKATKGLISLLEKRAHLIPPLFEKFKDVNDPYVTERLYAVAYGCTLRNLTDNKSIPLIAEWIFEHAFKHKKAPVHILIRDYARGIIDVASRRGRSLSFDPALALPPYASEWPKDIPSEEELEKKYHKDAVDVKGDEGKNFLSIWYSVMGFGDFARYIIGTNHHSSEWSGRRLGSSEPDREKIFSEFKTSLTPAQKELLEKATNLFYGIDLKIVFKNMSALPDKALEEIVEGQDLEAAELSEAEEKEKQLKADASFLDSLDGVQKEFFLKEIKPFMDDRGRVDDPLESFDLKIAQRWIFNRVVELGYDPAIHGKFDWNVNRYDNSARTEHKAERIGKKYQWIAYHQFMALVSDHFEFKGCSWGRSIEPYRGPWAPYVRDIDPSFISQADTQIKDHLNLSNWKSNGGQYDAWADEKTDTEWVRLEADLPNPSAIIEISDDEGSDWLMLKGLLVWQKKTPPEFESYEVPTRDLFYIVKSFIVKNEDKKKLLDWLDSKGWGNWLPESHDFYEVFLGEYPDTFPFEDFRGDYNIWTEASSDLPVPIVVTDDSYLNEFTLDCSKEGRVTVKLPNKWIVEGMELTQKYTDGRFYNSKDELVCLPNSIFDENERSALLVNKKSLNEFLEKNDCSIFWTILGEKKIVGGPDRAGWAHGRLNIHGVFTYEEGLLKGTLKNELETE
jgi:hypothetical protein